MNPEQQYINYNYLKTQIYNNNFVNLLKIELDNFDNYYEKQKQKNLNSKDLYNLIFINYLSYNKIVKKYKKHNPNCNLFNNSKKVNNFINDKTFFKDIFNLPKLSESNCNEKCSICLDKKIFPISLECQHSFCWSCLLQTSKKFNNCPYCRKECELDPVLNVINNIIPGKINKKYSPFNLEKKQEFEIMSDLHIDYWDPNIKSDFPCGPISNHPLKFNNNSDKILIIAGDVSDDLNKTIDFLNFISKYYKKILFTDGNHEHTDVYPKLHSTEKINNKITELNNNKIIYLPKENFFYNNSVFIGVCGWWDYNKKNSEVMKKNENYFKEWIPSLSKEQNLEFANNVIKRSEEEYLNLKNRIEYYEKDDKIDNIIIVTHTVPIKKFCDDQKVDTKMNMKYNELIKSSNKLSKWIFGHTHHNFYEKIDNIEYICNPRGRPADFNRIKYNSFSF